MKERMSSIEHRVLSILQEGLPKSRTPYKDMAQRIDIEVSHLLAVLKDWKKQGKLRRIGAIVSKSFQSRIGVWSNGGLGGGT